MKKTTITLIAATMLVAGAIFTSCKSPAQKEDAAEAKVEDAQQDLNAASQEVATAEEWQTFKSETVLKITDNEIRIAELKVKILLFNARISGVAIFKAETGPST